MNEGVVVEERPPPKISSLLPLEPLTMTLYIYVTEIWQMWLSLGS